MYWAKTNVIEIDTAILFAKLEIEETVKTKFDPGGPVATYESAESGTSPFMVIPIMHKKLKKILGEKRRKMNIKGQ